MHALPTFVCFDLVKPIFLEIYNVSFVIIENRKYAMVFEVLIF